MGRRKIHFNKALLYKLQLSDKPASLRQETSKDTTTMKKFGMGRILEIL
jgi:hypothetical protein